LHLCFLTIPKTKHFKQIAFESFMKEHAQDPPRFQNCAYIAVKSVNYDYALSGLQLQHERELWKLSWTLNITCLSCFYSTIMEHCRVILLCNEIYSYILVENWNTLVRFCMETFSFEFLAMEHLPSHHCYKGVLDLWINYRIQGSFNLNAYNFDDSLR